MDTPAFLASLNLPPRDAHDLPASARCFPGGGQYRVEIPTVEGREAFAAVVDAAAEHNVPVHCISQGTGIMLQTDAEIERIVKLGAETGIEVCLFPGPRAPGISACWYCPDVACDR